jgi:hypothetical protein
MVEATELLLRTTVVWAFGILAIGLLTGLAERSSRPWSPSALIIVPFVIARITTLICGVGISVLAAKAIIRHMPLLGLVSLVIAALASLWVTFMTTQAVQNLARRVVGAPRRPFQWMRGQPRR